MRKNITVRKKPIYENWKVYGPDGTLLFRCNNKRAKWYLLRSLGTAISSHSVKLNFTPAGRGSHGDDFSLQERVNECARCGNNDVSKLTKHHVVPHCYRRAIPKGLREHNFHDILPLCCDCHDEYEDKADQLKLKLCEEYGIPFNAKCLFNKERVQAYKLAFAIVKYGTKIPQARKDQIISFIRQHIGKEPTHEDLVKLSVDDPYEGMDYLRHGVAIMNEVMKEKDGYQNFAERWRQHFIVSTNPQHLPKDWNVKRKTFANT